VARAVTEKKKKAQEPFVGSRKKFRSESRGNMLRKGGRGGRGLSGEIGTPNKTTASGCGAACKQWVGTDLPMRGDGAEEDG